MRLEDGGKDAWPLPTWTGRTSLLGLAFSRRRMRREGNPTESSQYGPNHHTLALNIFKLGPVAATRTLRPRENLAKLYSFQRKQGETWLRK